MNARKIIDAMCDNAHMRGFFGDVSEEFRAEQTKLLENLSGKDQYDWLARNRSNLINHCDLSEDDLNIPVPPERAPRGWDQIEGNGFNDIDTSPQE